MEQKPIFLTEYALARVLKSFAKGLGLHDLMADATAQVFLQTQPAAKHWSTFLETNCARCIHLPSTCSYLNPAPEQVPEGSLPEHVQAAIALQVEMGRLQTCPEKE